MPSPEELANQSLAKIGIKGNKIGTLATPQSVEEIEVAKVWDTVRDAVLRAAKWGFAQKHDRLTLLEDRDPSDYGLAFAYQKPVDCLLFHEIYNPVLGAEPIDFQKHSSENLDTVEFWTNEASAIGVYTARVTATSAWDASFIQAFIYALAGEVAQVLTGSLKKEERVILKYNSLLPNAKKNDANEQRDSRRVTNRYKGARKG